MGELGSPSCELWVLAQVVEIRMKVRRTALWASARTSGGAVCEGSKLRLLAALRRAPLQFER